MVKLSARLLAAPRGHWRRCRPGTWPLPRAKDRDRATDRGTAHRIVARAARRAGIARRVIPHTLRHCHATPLLEPGVDLRPIQMLLGHADPKATTRHTHVSDEHLRSVVSPLDRLDPPRSIRLLVPPADLPELRDI